MHYFLGIWKFLNKWCSSLLCTQVVCMYNGTYRSSQSACQFFRCSRPIKSNRDTFWSFGSISCISLAFCMPNHTYFFLGDLHYDLHCVLYCVIKIFTYAIVLEYYWENIRRWYLWLSLSPHWRDLVLMIGISVFFCNTSSRSLPCRVSRQW